MIQGFNTHEPHQPGTSKRKLKMQSVNAIHQHLTAVADWLGLVVNRASADIQKLRLPLGDLIRVNVEALRKLCSRLRASSATLA